jgi:uncharacterized protein (TIGR02246 family)
MFATTAFYLVALISRQQPIKMTLNTPHSEITQSDESGVRLVLEGIDHAWNTHDMEAFAHLLADDCQWVNVVGMWWNGKESVKRAHIAFHHTMFKNVELRTEEASLRKIAPHVIVAIVRTHLGAYTTPSGHKVPETLNRMTMVLVEQSGKWVVTSAQNTPIDPIAAQFDPGSPKVAPSASAG